MHDYETRAAILKLLEEGHGVKTIARILHVSKKIVKSVRSRGSAEVPRIERRGKADGLEDRVRELFHDCSGNVIRVWEELVAQGIAISYVTVNRFCHEMELMENKKKPSGEYTFGPGKEMQHDTSPHEVTIGGRKRRVQCAAVLLSHSTMAYAQCYPTFNRFYCKLFLTEGVRDFDGSPEQCMVDNTHVVVAYGTGKHAVIAPEMEAFGKHFGFRFVAHEIGDANRSARVERFFHTVEHNFYPGRTFRDLADLNDQLKRWCDKRNRMYKKTIKAAPITLYQAERVQLHPLPIYIPEVNAIHHRTVDTEGYVSLHTNRYSVPGDMVGRPVEVRDSYYKVRVYLGHQLIAEHVREEDGAGQRKTLKEHEYAGRWRKKGETVPIPEEEKLVRLMPRMATYIGGMRKKMPGRCVQAVRRLYRFYMEYPTEAIEKALEEAIRFGLYDLHRLEHLILRFVVGDYFKLPEDDSYGRERYGR